MPTPTNTKPVLYRITPHIMHEIGDRDCCMEERAYLVYGVDHQDALANAHKIGYIRSDLFYTVKVHPDGEELCLSGDSVNPKSS